MAYSAAPNQYEAGKPEEGDPFPYPLATPISNRANSTATDGFLTNCFTEQDAYGELWVQKRPGYSLQFSFAGAQNSQGLTFHAGLLYAASANVLFRLTASASGYSTTGVAWSSIAVTNPWPVRVAYPVVMFQDQYMAFGGSAGASDFADVWSSPDGTRWSQIVASAPWTPRNSSNVVVFNNELYLVGGFTVAGVYLNDVWKSPDGLNWVQLTSAAQFSARRGHALVAFNNGIFLIGGYTGATYLNDVWFTTDGITWLQINAAAAFGTRYLHSVVVFKDKMWLYGGYNGALQNDLYSSPDGKVWTLQNAAALGTARDSVGMVVYQDRIMIIGGCTVEPGITYTADVYLSNAAGTVYVLVTAAPGWAAGSFYNRTVIARLPIGISPTRQSSVVGVGRNDAGGASAGSNDIYYSQLGVTVQASFPIPSTVVEDLYFVEQNAGRYLLMKDSQGLYVFDQNVILQVTDYNYPGLTVDGIVNLDDTVYVMDPDGTIFGSDLSTPWTWNALNFETAEYEADKGVRLVKYLNYVVALKENTIQFFQDVGSTPGSPLLPMRNQTSRVGCAAAKSVAVVGNTLVWVCRTNTDLFQVVKLNGFVPTPISTPFINRLLTKIADGTVVCKAWSCLTKGHNFYILRLSGAVNITLVYDMDYKEWHTWTTSDGVSVFPANFYATDGASNYILNDFFGEVYKLDDTVYGDNNANIPISITTNQVDGGTHLYKFFPRIDLVGDKDNGTMNLSWSDNDYGTFSTPRAATTTADKSRTGWSRCGRSRKRAFRLTNTTNNKPFRQKRLEFIIYQGMA